MPRFSYQAKKGPQELIKGIIEAESEQAAVEKLGQMGCVPVRVIPLETIGKEAKRNAAFTLGLFKGVRARDLTVFLEQLSILVKAKVPILEAMRVLQNQTENSRLREVISDVQNTIKDGASLSAALSRHPDVFERLYVNMIEAGEAGGMLEESLVRLVDLRNKEEEFKSTISSALAYPIFIVIVGIATVFVLLGFIIPKIGVLFDELGQRLPLSTQLLLSLAEIIKNYWYLLPLAIIILAVLFKKQKLNKRQRRIFDGLKLRLPLIGDFCKKSFFAYFARTLGALLRNGISLLGAIRIIIPTVDNEIFKSQLEAMHQDITAGMSLEQAIKRSSLFPQFVSNMISVGEKSGNLEGSLLEVSGFYVRQLNKTSKIITSLFEPAIILVMGLVVGFIVFAMLLPIFQINLTIQ